MKIKILEGTWNDECTTQLNLTNANMLNPDAGYDKVITYAEQRQLMTFLTAGATNGAFTVSRTTDAYKTRIPMIPEGELIDGKAWKYSIMGRIQKACEILGDAVVGAISAGDTYTGGYFTLKLRDSYLQPDMNALFWNGKMAKVFGQPRKAPGYYLYTFQTFPGDTFTWASWIAPQVGQKTLWGGYSMHGERSLRGYGRAHYPDTFINHTTIQRKGIAITGDANANKVLWYMTGEGVNSSKGWIYWLEAQARAQFLMEDEFEKWFGKSTMKDADGNLMSTPSMIDVETGMPIWAGDGYIEQIKGANDVEASGADGEAVWDDFADLISEVKKKTVAVAGQLFYCVTGADGMANVHKQNALHGKNYYNITMNVPQTDKPGGADLPMGFNFNRMNVRGAQIVFVENPMFDRDDMFPRRLTNGKLAQSGTYYLMDNSKGETGKPNVEIRARGRQGVNRNMVYYYFNGMTGEGTPQGTVDGKEFQMLKENMLVIYNTKSHGIISPPATA
ncbi:MAG: hypothetical protein WC222_11290 [Parachlamydiales bacterium]|jgi:hypothetical protein